MAKAKITEKQQQFVIEYLIDLNATQAYIRAGYKVSETVASVNACKLLGNTKIQNLVQKAMAERASRCRISQDEVIMQLKSIAFNEGARDSDRIRALDLLGRHLGMFRDRVEVTNTMDITGKLCPELEKLADEAMERLKKSPDECVTLS